MAPKRSDEFRREAVCIALTSGRRQVSSDLGVGIVTLPNWGKIYRDTDIISKDDQSLAKENELHTYPVHYETPIHLTRGCSSISAIRLRQDQLFQIYKRPTETYHLS